MGITITQVLTLIMTCLTMAQTVALLPSSTQRLPHTRVRFQRISTPDHYLNPQLFDIPVLAHSEPSGLIFDSLDDDEDFRIDENNLFYAALYEDNLLGFLIVQIQHHVDLEEKTPKLMWVHEEYQKLGLHYYLMLFAMNDLLAVDRSFQSC